MGKSSKIKPSILSKEPIITQILNPNVMCTSAIAPASIQHHANVVLLGGRVTVGSGDTSLKFVFSCCDYRQEASAAIQ